jgi:hypothetical protein
MTESLLFFEHNAVTIAIFIAYWLVSAACSALPPLPPNAGWWTTWAHNTLQIFAANFNKIGKPPLA